MLGHLLVFQKRVNSPASLAKATEHPCSTRVLFVLLAVRCLKACVAVNVNAIKAKHRFESRTWTERHPRCCLQNSRCLWELGAGDETALGQVLTNSEDFMVELVFLLSFIGVLPQREH